MNWLARATPLFLIALCAAPARAQGVPLVVGSVRDQHGAPINGATILALAADGKRSRARSAVDGTFAVEIARAVSVTIECRYCASRTFAVRAGTPVVAILHRFDALATEAPSPYDLANLPYAHVESAIALRPFTLLAQTRQGYPGPLLADRGLSASGSLLIDDGVPVYDVAGGLSPYAMIPALYETSATIVSAGDAFLYGDRAAGGTVTTTPMTSGSPAQNALFGSDGVARAQGGSAFAQIAAGTFGNDLESRQRADANLAFSLPANQSLAVVAGTEQGRTFDDTPLASAFSFASAAWSDPRAANLAIAALADRGTYGWEYDEGYPESAGWSDAQVSAGAHTNGSLAAFADLVARLSTGTYDARLLGLPLVAASSVQAHADAGVQATGSEYDLTAAVAAFSIGYRGGAYGVSQAGASLVTPSLQTRLFPNDRFSIALQGSGAFTLPTYAQQYLDADRPENLAFSRDSLYAAQLDYSDDSRLKVSFEVATQNVRGASAGVATSAGLSAIWQISPLLSLRAWSMHVSDTAQVYGSPAYDGTAPTTGVLWLTYGGTLRIDTIYRRDLLDGAPFYHVDAAVSGPLTGELRWYAGAEDRTHRTFVDAGLRVSPP